MSSLTRPAVAVGVGGAAGAICRWAVAHALAPEATWPWATLVVNAAGCLLLGYVVVRLIRSPARAWLWRDGLGTGFCGGLTTFSTFTVEIAELLRDHDAVLASSYLVASVLTGYGAFALGRRTAHRRMPRPTSDLQPVSRG